MKVIIHFLLLFNVMNLYAQEEVSIQSDDVALFGTLTQPEEKTDQVVLIIAGSGPTNRDGNTLPVYTNNCLKMLAESLAAQGIASLRYDKRGVGKSANESIKPEELRFEDFVQDAENWLKYLKEKYEKVIIAGHSQGALIGMLIAKNKDVDQFISIAGQATDAYSLLKKQLSADTQPKFVQDAALPLLDSLHQGHELGSVPDYLKALFGPQVQDFLKSYMKYDPRQAIKQLKIPILVIQGMNDLQISVDEAKELASLNKNAKLVTIEGMNHVLKNAPKETQANLATYANATLPLNEEFVEAILAFVK